MEQREMSYSELKNKVIEFLESKRAIVLATSLNDNVIARTVSYVNKDLQLYFWSYKNHEKCKQIKNNPTVALCRDNLQVEGLATLHGNILDPKNKMYLAPFKNKFPKDYDRYINEPKMILVKVKPTLFVFLENVDGTLYRNHLNVTKKLVYSLEMKEDSNYALNN